MTTDKQDWPEYTIDKAKHESGTWNVIGTIIGCECEWCKAKVQQIIDYNEGAEIKSIW